MRLLCILCILLSLSARATDYYVSNFGLSINDGITVGTPWNFQKFQTEVAKTSGSLIKAGDRVYFNRGETFFGTITVGMSGTAALTPVLFGAYGSGAKPVISGFITVNSWTTVATNIYESTLAISALDKMNVVSLNGTRVSMGRYPNANATNKGWLESDAVTGTTTLRDAALPQSPSWVGARIVNRRFRFSIDTSTVLSHTYANGASTLTCTPDDDNLRVGYGYILTNHPSTLDQQGEWYYNPVSKKLRIYLTTAPSNYSIRGSRYDDLLTIAGRKFLVFENLVFEGANNMAVRGASNTQNIVFNACEFKQVGNIGVYSGQSSTCSNWQVVNCLFEDVSNHAMDYRNGESLTLSHSTFKRTGIMAAQGVVGYSVYLSGGNGHRVEYCYVDSSGYAGIRWNGTNVYVGYNEVANYDMVIDDGGGIYSGNTTSKAGSVVEYNYVRDGVGAPEGTTASNRYAVGIYQDDGSSGLTIRNNIVTRNPESGIYLHNNNNVVVYGNMAYDNGKIQLKVVNDDDDGDYAVAHNLTVKQNYCIATTASQFCAGYWTWKDSTYIHRFDEAAGAGAGIGVNRNIDSNYYMRPTDEDRERLYIIWKIYQDSAILNPNGTTTYVSLEQRRNYTLEDWNSYYFHDQKTGGSPVKYPFGTLASSVLDFRVNFTEDPLVLPLTRTYKTHKNESVTTTTYTIPPYTAVLFLKWDAPIVLPPTLPNQDRFIYRSIISKRVLINTRRAKLLGNYDQ